MVVVVVRFTAFSLETVVRTRFVGKPILAPAGRSMALFVTVANQVDHHGTREN